MCFGLVLLLLICNLLDDLLVMCSWLRMVFVTLWFVVWLVVVVVMVDWWRITWICAFCGLIMLFLSWFAGCYVFGCSQCTYVWVLFWVWFVLLCFLTFCYWLELTFIVGFTDFCVLVLAGLRIGDFCLKFVVAYFVAGGVSLLIIFGLWICGFVLLIHCVGG